MASGNRKFFVNPRKKIEKTGAAHKSLQTLHKTCAKLLDKCPVPWYNTPCLASCRVLLLRGVAQLGSSKAKTVDNCFRCAKPPKARSIGSVATLRARDDYATVAFSPKGARPGQRLGQTKLQLYIYNEVWLSLVERYVRDVEAAGSNPVTSTIRKRRVEIYPSFLCF